MLYNEYPRTFDLSDVTGVMNICDRHMGAIAMRVLVTVICLSTVCAFGASGSAHSRSPPRSVYAPVSCGAHRRVVYERAADYAQQIVLESCSRRKRNQSCHCRDNWFRSFAQIYRRNVTTGESGSPAQQATRQHGLCRQCDIIVVLCSFE